MAGALLPDRPRLNSRCHVFESGEGLVVRSVVGALLIAAEHRAAMERILPRLDGHHDFPALLAGIGAQDGFYALRMLAHFAEANMLSDGPHLPPPAAASPRPVDLTGIGIVVLDDGRLSNVVVKNLSSLRPLLFILLNKKNK